MERRLIGFILGILSNLVWPQVPGFGISAIILILGLLLIQRQPLLSSLMIGISYCAFVVNFQFSDLQYLKLENSSITGTIISLPEQRKYNNRFFFRLSKIRSSNVSRRSNAILLVYWPGIHQLKQGQQLTLSVRVRPIHGMANQGGFNYQKWLVSKGVGATAKVVEGVISKNEVAVRASIANEIAYAVDRLSHGRFIRALALADKQSFSNDDWTLVGRTGTSHLFAISGLHLSIVFGMAFAITQLLILPLGNRILLFERHSITISSLIAIGAALGYSYLSGFSLPTTRALIMLTIIAGASIAEQRLSLLQLVLLSLAAVLVYDPLSVLAISFWLSFCAVCALLFLFFIIKRRSRHHDGPILMVRNSLHALFKMQMWLFISMLGVQLLFFNGISLVAPVANLVAVPLVSLVVLPLVLIAMTVLVVFSQQWIASLLFSAANELLSILFSGLELLGAIPSSWFSSGRFEFWLVTVGLLAIVGCLLAIDIGRQKIIVLLMAVGCSASTSLISYRQHNDWTVHFLDVGQGNAAVIERDGYGIVVDTGRASRTGSSISELVILPFLRKLSITKLDYILLTHQDNDHAGGWRQLSNQFPESKIISNWPQKPKGAKVIDCHRLTAQGIDWHGLNLSFFIAPPGFSKNENDNSCVVKISDAEHSVLFTGDISSKTETLMVNTQGQHWQSEIIQVPHHGSKTSSTMDFIEFIAPTLAIVSAGRFNQWRFPAQSVQTNYRQAGALIESTANSGQISIDFSPNEVPRLRRLRHDIAPFWYNNDLSFEP